MLKRVKFLFIALACGLVTYTYGAACFRNLFVTCDTWQCDGFTPGCIGTHTATYITGTYKSNTNLGTGNGKDSTIPSSERCLGVWEYWIPSTMSIATCSELCNVGRSSFIPNPDGQNCP